MEDHAHPAGMEADIFCADCSKEGGIALGYKIDEVVALNLRTLRLERKLTQEALAERAGVSKQTISVTIQSPMRKRLKNAGNVVR